MVDRYKSLMGEDVVVDSINRDVRLNQIVDVNREIVQRTNSHSIKMREIINRYRRNVSRDADDCISEFKEEQMRLVKDRTLLKNQLDTLQNKNKKDTPEYNFMKKQLLRAIKNEIELDLELNKEVTKRKQQREKLKQDMLKGSPKLADAVRDIEAKLQSIEQCLQLLEVIGILTFQNGEKLDDVYHRVREANIQIEAAEVNIDRARIAMEKSRCKMCCIIILALIAIIFIGIVLFGIVKIQNTF